MLCKQYGAAMVLKNLNLSIQQGEIYCLLGQNGAGKTTTINLFLGFIQASSGKIFINNTEVKINDNLPKEFISYIPEVVQLYDNLTGIENLDYFSRLAEKKYNSAELANFLTETGLQKSAHHKTLKGYSKGMRQKVAIAIALAKNAKVIFMDEPTSGLDPMATDEFSKIVGQLKQQGKTVFMATHDIFNAVNIASTIGIMKNGELVQQLDPKNITAVELQKLYLETV